MDGGDHPAVVTDGWCIDWVVFFLVRVVFSRAHTNPKFLESKHTFNFKRPKADVFITQNTVLLHLPV